jgi:hypothetical protein
LSHISATASDIILVFLITTWLRLFKMIHLGSELFVRLHDEDDGDDDDDELAYLKYF